MFDDIFIGFIFGFIIGMVLSDLIWYLYVKRELHSLIEYKKSDKQETPLEDEK